MRVSGIRFLRGFYFDGNGEWVMGWMGMGNGTGHGTNGMEWIEGMGCVKCKKISISKET